MFSSTIQTKQFFSVKSSHRKEVCRRVQFACLVLMFGLFRISILHGAQFGDYTYTVIGSSVTITDFPTTISGSIVIPSQIEGKTVTKIADFAFQYCSITSVTIPSGVTSIGGYCFSGNFKLLEVIILSNSVTLGSSVFSSCKSLKTFTMSAISGAISRYAFQECRSLETVIIPPAVSVIGEAAFIGCWGLKNLEIGSSVTSIGRNAFAECWQIKDVTLPSGLVEIGPDAFADCAGITKIRIPASVTTIATHAFQFCTNLSEVTFVGDAPLMGANVFYGAKSNFTIYYYNESTGFSSPLWYNFPAVNMDFRSTGEWLDSYGFSYNTDLQSDPNNDGVNLLLAYAFNLNPRVNLSGSMPRAVITNGFLSMKFYAGSSNVNYVVETSDDLNNWTTSGVILSPIDGNQERTATIPVSDSQRFLRIVVSQ